MKKLDPSTIGLLQALGVIIYIALFVLFLQAMARTVVEPAELLGAIVMLTLLVFSAAITGTIVFAYPAWLGINKRMKEALTVLAFTLLYCLGFVMLIIISIMVFV